MQLQAFVSPVGIRNWLMVETGLGRIALSLPTSGSLLGTKILGVPLPAGPLIFP